MSESRQEGDLVNYQTIKTCTSAFTFQYIWKIENVIKLSDYEIVESPVFEGKSKSQDKWKLIFRPVNNNKQFQLALQLMESEMSGPIKGDFQIYFLNSDDKIIWADTRRKDEFVAGQEGKFFSVIYKTVLLNPAFEFLTNGKSITIYIQVTTYEDKFFNPLKRKQAEAEDRVKKQMKIFLENRECTDVTLKTEKSSFGASKLILSAHSPVFRTMFSTDMLESKDNVVMMDDFPDDVILSFLEYLHTGQTDSLEENALDLLRISEKYQVVGLKEKCEEIVMKELNTNNAADILIVAYLYSPTTLKPKVVKFVNENIGDVKQADSFKKMQRTHPQIFVDLFTAITEED